MAVYIFSLLPAKSRPFLSRLIQSKAAQGAFYAARARNTAKQPKRAYGANRWQIRGILQAAIVNLSRRELCLFSIQLNGRGKRLFSFFSLPGKGKPGAGHNAAGGPAFEWVGVLMDSAQAPPGDTGPALYPPGSPAKPELFAPPIPPAKLKRFAA